MSKVIDKKKYYVMNIQQKEVEYEITVETEYWSENYNNLLIEMSKNKEIDYDPEPKDVANTKYTISEATDIKLERAITLIRKEGDLNYDLNLTEYDNLNNELCCGTIFMMRTLLHFESLHDNNWKAEEPYKIISEDDMKEITYHEL
jgi:hypothetical protein